MAKEIKTRIETANAEAFRRLVAADPVLVDVAPAGDVIPGLTDKIVLHSGPPVDWQRMSGAQKGAAVGIDVRKVVQTNIPPIIDTAMAHKNPGHPIIGAAVSFAPHWTASRRL